MTFSSMRLGVNLDHVATLRQARGGSHPSVVQAAHEAERGGADGITVHLREDRRHIQDRDLWDLKRAVRVPLNLEMALSPEILRIALRLRPEKVCVVPERRRELTTEGGLDVRANFNRLRKVIPQFQKKGIEVSLFIDPDPVQTRASAEVAADAIEVHTGAYANAAGTRRLKELAKVRRAAELGHGLGLKIHAGHGLDYRNVRAIARVPWIEELNIGHAIISYAVFHGLRKSVSDMKRAMRVRS